LKIQTFEKPLSFLLFRPPVFKSQSVTGSINCHVANLQRTKPRFLPAKNGKERIMPDKRGLFSSALFMGFL